MEAGKDTDIWLMQEKQRWPGVTEILRYLEITGLPLQKGIN